MPIGWKSPFPCLNYKYIFFSSGEAVEKEEESRDPSLVKRDVQGHVHEKRRSHGQGHYRYQNFGGPTQRCLGNILLKCLILNKFDSKLLSFIFCTSIINMFLVLVCVENNTFFCQVVQDISLCNWPTR